MVVIYNNNNIVACAYTVCLSITRLPRTHTRVQGVSAVWCSRGDNFLIFEQIKFFFFRVVCLAWDFFRVGSKKIAVGCENVAAEWNCGRKTFAIVNNRQTDAVRLAVVHTYSVWFAILRPVCGCSNFADFLKAYETRRIVFCVLWKIRGAGKLYEKSRLVQNDWFEFFKLLKTKNMFFIKKK